MKLWEKPSGIIFRLFAAPYLRTFEENSPEKILKRSVNVLDKQAIEGIKEYVTSSQTQSGGFADKAGHADIYYTLFGNFLADALEMKDMIPSIKRYAETRSGQNDLAGVNLYCATILSARLCNDQRVMTSLQRKVQESINAGLSKQPAYGAFLNLLTCYYAKDYRSLYLIRNQLRAFDRQTTLPCPVLAALLVLQESFHKPTDKLKNELLLFLTGNGGFKATQAAPMPDLLSTAVALYALRFAGADLRGIKPGCLDFIDSMYTDGGFGGNAIDRDPDIEYTFYGLLALGALAD
jgi:hypothetical protein